MLDDNSLYFILKGKVKIYVGNNKKRRYFDQCIFLETITDGRAKIQIINGKKGGTGIRYVSKSKLIDMYCTVK